MAETDATVQLSQPLGEQAGGAEAARLAAALERIARLSAERAHDPAAEGGAVAAEVTARLDALISQIRKLLHKSAG